MPRKINSLFRMPAEWEKQQSTLIGWPHNKNDWPGMFKNIPNVFARICLLYTSDAADDS